MCEDVSDEPSNLPTLHLLSYTIEGQAHGNAMPFLLLLGCLRALSMHTPGHLASLRN